MVDKFHNQIETLKQLSENIRKRSEQIIFLKKIDQFKEEDIKSQTTALIVPSETIQTKPPCINKHLNNLNVIEGELVKMEVHFESNLPSGELNLIYLKTKQEMH